MRRLADTAGPALAALILLAACAPVGEGPSTNAPAPSATPAGPAPRPKPPEPVDIAELLGTTPEAAMARLGSPAATREETPARVMTWRVGACTLDLFFYMDLASRAFRALAWELRPAAGQPVATVCPGPPRGPA